MMPAAPLDIRAFIDQRPVSRYQVLVAVLCGLIVFVDGFGAGSQGAFSLRILIGLPREICNNGRDDNANHRASQGAQYTAGRAVQQRGLPAEAAG